MYLPPQASPGPAVAQPPPATSTSSSLIVDRGRPDRAPPAPGPTAADASRTTGVGGAVAALPAARAPFILRGLRVEGASAPDAAFRPVLRSFLGRRMDGAGLAALADAVSKAYAGSDVALYTVLIPDQDFAQGVVRVRIVEGFVEALDVKTRKGRAAPQVEAYARPLLRQRPLRKSSFDRAVLLMRSLPGTTVDVSFQRGSRDGAVRMVVRADVKRVQFGVGVSDRGANQLGRTQLEADLTLNSLFREGDRTGLVFATPTDFTRFRYYALSHSQPIGDSGLTVQGSLGYLTTRPSGSSTTGEAKIASLQATWPAILTPTRTLYLTGSIDGIDSSNALLGRLITDERVRTVRAAAAFAQGFGTTGSLTLGVTLSQGLPGIGAQPAAPGYSDTDFRKISIQAAAAKTYGRWTVRLRATAQASGDRLPSSEQLALGGDDYGRAFPAAIVTGDQGAAASAELAYSLSKWLPKLLAGSEVYGFLDGGRVNLASRPAYGLAGQTYDLASSGLGARAPVAAHTVLQLEASRQLVARLPGEQDDDWRVVFGYRSNY